MKEIDKVNEILDQVGRLDGITSLRLSEQGAAKLQFAGGREVFFEYRHETSVLFLYIPLFRLPPDMARRESLMHAMLASNFLKLEGSGELAIDEDSDQAIYQAGLDVHLLDVERLDRQIDELLRQSAEFRSALRGRRNARLLRPRGAESMGGRLRGLLSA